MVTFTAAPQGRRKLSLEQPFFALLKALSPKTSQELEILRFYLKAETLTRDNTSPCCVF